MWSKDLILELLKGVKIEPLRLGDRVEPENSSLWFDSPPDIIIIFTVCYGHQGKLSGLESIYKRMRIFFFHLNHPQGQLIVFAGKDRGSMLIKLREEWIHLEDIFNNHP